MQHFTYTLTELQQSFIAGCVYTFIVYSMIIYVAIRMFSEKQQG